AGHIRRSDRMQSCPTQFDHSSANGDSLPLEIDAEHSGQHHWDSMGRSPTQIGFAGVAAEWLGDDLTALRRHQRMRISSVFDTTPAVGTLGAKRLEAEHCRGLYRLLDSPLVDAVVVGNPGWMGWHPVLQSVKRGLPTLFVVSRLTEEAFFDPQLPEQVRLEVAIAYARGSGGGFLMPGLPLRWLPVTIRVRELTATALGAIEHLEVDAPGTPLRSRNVAELLDWALSVVQSAPASLKTRETEAGVELLLACRRRTSGNEAVTIALRGLRRSGRSEVISSELNFAAHGHCRHGEFTLTAPHQIQHTVDRSMSQESLCTDRSGFDIMLDLFGRRLVGGVVPVPDFADMLRARNLVIAAHHSLARDAHVVLSDEGHAV
ncbi:MAG: hypothetical protein KDA58_15305, partial [Planctomycetaceae bacterium]|nr:hypothetical protein [Planctomycetaceae bacterium]